MDFWELVSSHHGVATDAELIEAGFSRSTIDRWVHDGRLLRVHKCTYVFAAAPDTFHRRCWIALKAAPGSALSHRTAAYLWGLIADEPPVEIVVPRGRTPDVRGVIVHQTRDPYVSHVRRGLRVTSPLRTVVDLGAVAPRAVWDAVDRGRVANLFTIAAIEWQMVDVARRGRRGVGALRRVLDEWALDRDRPDGLLEPRFARLRVRYALPEPVFQFEVGTYRIDFAYPELMIAIEVDGYESRANPRRQQHDYERQSYLTNLGWEVHRFMWADVVRRPAHVAAVLRTAIGRAPARMRALARPEPDGEEQPEGQVSPV